MRNAQLRVSGCETGDFLSAGETGFRPASHGQVCGDGKHGAPPAGEAGRFAEGEEQNRKVLLGSAVPPPEEISSKAPNLPIFIISKSPNTKNLILRVITSDRNRVNPRPPFIIRRQAYIIHHMPQAYII